MAIDERSPTSSVASRVSDLDPRLRAKHWRDVEACLQIVFGQSEAAAHSAVLKLQAEEQQLSDLAALLLYHNTPLQTASILAGAANRPLTEDELLAYDSLWRRDSNRTDLPGREEILQVHGLVASKR